MEGKMQKKRVREDIRYIFTPDEKAEMLKKSNGRCARCGKSLEVGKKDLTVEHIIPLSKGGKNEHNNLVCLCKACNKEKADKVVQASWYKYIEDEEEVEKIRRLLFRYIKSYCHLSDTNLLPVDECEMKMLFNAKTGDVFYDESGRVLPVTKTVVWKKANFKDDYNKILKAYVRVYNKLGLDISNLHREVAFFLRNCCTYYIEDKHGEVKVIVPVSLRRTGLADAVKKELYGSTKAHKKLICVAFYDIINCTNKYVWAGAITNLMLRILHSTLLTLGTEAILTVGYCKDTSFVRRDLSDWLLSDMKPEEVHAVNAIWGRFLVVDNNKSGLRTSKQDLDEYIEVSERSIKELGLDIKDISLGFDKTN